MITSGRGDPHFGQGNGELLIDDRRKFSFGRPGTSQLRHSGVGEHLKDKSMYSKTSNSGAMRSGQRKTFSGARVIRDFNAGNLLAENMHMDSMQDYLDHNGVVDASGERIILNNRDSMMDVNFVGASNARPFYHD